MRRAVTVVITWLFLWHPSVPGADPPATVHYQGVLRDATDAPVDGPRDMSFVFYGDEVAGDEILIDTHDAVNSSPVTVSGGLFDVSLGSGAVSDGAGPGSYTSLTEVFRDYGQVWMEVRVDGETLTPRVEVEAAPYAHNATHLAGRSAGQFLDTSSAFQTKSGSLRVHSLFTSSSVELDLGGRLQRFGNELWVEGGPAGSGLLLKATYPGGGGQIRLRENLPLEFRAPAGGYEFKDIDTGNTVLDVRNGGDLVIDGQFQLGALNQDVTVEFGGNGILQWDESQSRFELTQGAAIHGPLRVGTSGGTATSYSFFGPAGSAGPASGAMNGSEDVYIVGDLEAGTYHGDTFEVVDVQFDMNGGDLRFNARSQHRVMVDSDDTTTANFAGWYHDGVYTNTTQLAKLTEAGNFQIRGTLSQNVSFDVAESFLALEPLEPGELVRVDPSRPDAVRRTAGAGDPAVVGVVSTRPGVVLGSAPFSPEGLRETWGDAVADEFLSSLPDLREQVLARLPELADAPDDEVVAQALEAYWSRAAVPVALAGRVPVEVDASYGAIEIGDPLAPSPVPGVAMKATSAGPTVGFALEARTTGRGTLLAFVQRGQIGDPSAAAPPDGGESRLVSDEVAPAPPPEPTTTVEPTSSVVAVAPALADREPSRSPVSFGPTFESLPTRSTVAPADVVVIDRDDPDRVRAASRAHDVAVIGVAADVPDAPTRPGHAIVALSGIVDVRADAGYGAIRIGDALVTSHTPGHVMSAIDPEPMTVVGKALSELDSGVGTVRVLLLTR